MGTAFEVFASNYCIGAPWQSLALHLKGSLYEFQRKFRENPNSRGGHACARLAHRLLERCPSPLLPEQAVRSAQDDGDEDGAGVNGEGLAAPAGALF